VLSAPGCAKKNTLRCGGCGSLARAGVTRRKKKQVGKKRKKAVEIYSANLAYYQ
jgi:hypothetical protein